MNYPVVIHKDRRSDYGVTVPDLPGCFSAGSTFDEALAMAQEAIELHLEGLIEEGEPIPAPSAIEAHRRSRRFSGGTWALVAVDQSKLRLGAKRINITLPERTLDAVDRFARTHHDTRSGLLAKAAMDYIDREVKAVPSRPAPSQSSSRRRHRKN
jgi:predicted RNase H-like HicB family nuclease